MSLQENGPVLRLSLKWRGMPSPSGAHPMHAVPPNPDQVLNGDGEAFHKMLRQKATEAKPSIKVYEDPKCDVCMQDSPSEFTPDPFYPQLCNVDSGVVACTRCQKICGHELSVVMRNYDTYVYTTALFQHRFPRCLYIERSNGDVELWRLGLFIARRSMDPDDDDESFKFCVKARVESTLLTKWLDLEKLVALNHHCLKLDILLLGLQRISLYVQGLATKVRRAWLEPFGAACRASLIFSLTFEEPAPPTDQKTAPLERGEGTLDPSSSNGDDGGDQKLPEALAALGVGGAADPNLDVAAGDKPTTGAGGGGGGAAAGASATTKSTAANFKTASSGEPPLPQRIQVRPAEEAAGLTGVAKELYQLPRECLHAVANFL